MCTLVIVLWKTSEFWFWLEEKMPDQNSLLTRYIIPIRALISGHCKPRIHMQEWSLGGQEAFEQLSTIKWRVSTWTHRTGNKSSPIPPFREDCGQLSTRGLQPDALPPNSDTDTNISVTLNKLFAFSVPWSHHLWNEESTGTEFSFVVREKWNICWV